MNQFITDEELRAAGVSELDIDALNFWLIAQKLDSSGKRDRTSVEYALAARGVTVNLRDR